MSQRFTVTAFNASDIQGEVNQLFEGDEPTPSSSNKEVSFNTEVVVMEATPAGEQMPVIVSSFTSTGGGFHGGTTSVARRRGGTRALWRRHSSRDRR
ncbi:hypothetical protein DPEC_G00194370 [Dallia pectoralis]|uniref:Uncharacterized protein n=1 Tax=Dallia pectoralis TaxID=75939 RepID=A0ACC2G701_DALPE|nr:hypothetical protein DPEC_G00194370 [Dallia pectoralis]